jgi:hypothetical protein
MTAIESSSSVSWPQLSTELKLEILSYLLVVNTSEEEEEMTPIRYLGLGKNTNEDLYMGASFD